VSQLKAELDPDEVQHSVVEAAGRPCRRGARTPSWSRRRVGGGYSAKYKLAIAREADGCSRPGEVGALLRREGLYSSHLGKWRAQRDTGALGALERRQRGPRPPSADAVELVKVRRELDRSRADLETARRVIEVQGNVSALLEELLSKSATETDDVFSRYAVGWTVQHRENGHVAKALIGHVCDQQQIQAGQLTVHADRGSSMRSKPPTRQHQPRQRQPHRPEPARQPCPDQVGSVVRRSDRERCGACEAPVAEIVERLVGILQWVAGDLCPDGDTRGAEPEQRAPWA
jgi:transposase